MMRLHCVRFTVRRLMIAVAIVALLLAVGLEARWMHREYQGYTRRAFLHSYGETMNREWAAWEIKSEAGYRSMVEKYSQGGFDDRLLHLADRNGKNAAKYTLRADYHARMKAKYQAAARRPWLPVEPDPPRPEL
jgi:hypothetical protein